MFFGEDCTFATIKKVSLTKRTICSRHRRWLLVTSKWRKKSLKQRNIWQAGLYVTESVFFFWFLKQGKGTITGMSKRFVLLQSIERETRANITHTHTHSTHLNCTSVASAGERNAQTRKICTQERTKWRPRTVAWVVREKLRFFVFEWHRLASFETGAWKIRLFLSVEARFD